jgi:hypothetical protein
MNPDEEVIKTPDQIEAEENENAAKETPTTEETAPEAEPSLEEAGQ